MNGMNKLLYLIFTCNMQSSGLRRDVCVRGLAGMGNLYRRLFAAVAFIGLAAPWGASFAQGFPSRQITIVVPFAAGGPSDTMARLVAEAVGTQTGSRVIVENMAGAGGTTGSAKVAHAEPDGHTLVFGNIGTHAANVGLYKKLPYDPATDFEPVAIVANVPLVLSVRNSHPAKTLAEFVAQAKASPGTLNYGSAGVGSASHLGCLLLDAAIGARSRHVPYRGVGPALNDLVAGQIDFVCDQTITMMPQIQGGTIRPLATLSARRLAALPELPTLAEAGISDVEVEVWNAIFAPKGTPREITARLFEMIAAGLAEGGARKRFIDLGSVIPPRELAGPEVLRALVVREVARWRAGLLAAGVAVQ
ncbi:MAG: tripartite tricarboxylate transporter substrate-binding protein [Hyphomicrobiaceae bacterium]|nr:tripartite tricarboxylate transporter substrate-binding protein [Hyphomicrobiaceae bacterium]